jgi:predicted CopG family antitoxin
VWAGPRPGGRRRRPDADREALGAAPQKQLLRCVLANTRMSVRTVTLAQDAYEALKARKEKGESFSDVVRRLSGIHPSLAAFAGAWKEYPADRLKEFEDWLSWSDSESISEMKPPARGRRRVPRG